MRVRLYWEKAAHLLCYWRSRGRIQPIWSAGGGSGCRSVGQSSFGARGGLHVPSRLAVEAETRSLLPSRQSGEEILPLPAQASRAPGPAHSRLPWGHWRMMGTAELPAAPVPPSNLLLLLSCSPSPVSSSPPKGIQPLHHLTLPVQGKKRLAVPTREPNPLHMVEGQQLLVPSATFHAETQDPSPGSNAP